MTGTFLNPGDELDATVQSVTPFGLLVRTDAGVPGLIRGARATAGATVRLRVVEYDAVEARFSATLID